MDKNQKQQRQRNGTQAESVNGTATPEDVAGSQEVVPGVPVVRSNTPRPLSFESMLAPNARSQSGTFQVPQFPAKAPSAPPLPEELGVDDGEVQTHAPASPTQSLVAEEAQDFIWLFEYGLEMDMVTLNSPDHLAGQALIYGPAVLKGYTVLFGAPADSAEGQRHDPSVVTIVPAMDARSEVWGMLYRVPRRLSEASEQDSCSLLDRVHAETHIPSRPVQVVVHDVYRNRELSCVTYMVSEEVRRHLHLASVEQVAHTPFVQRFTQLVRKLKLPEGYLSVDTAPPVSAIPTPANVYEAAFPGMLDTDPLPVIGEGRSVSTLGSTLPHIYNALSEIGTPAPTGWLIAFALYLVLILVVVLVFAVFQGLGFGQEVLDTGFTVLGIPWLVCTYGLLGGCISSLISLGRSRYVTPPLFVLITWFVRPFVGAILAGLAYLILTSGLFVLTPDSQHGAVFLLAGVLAGCCETWIFVRRRW